MADRYLIADEVLTGHGLHWYEVSNWAATAPDQCAHNLLYWTGGDWWGVGPGAHSHVGGTRWWNVKHPAAYAGRIAAGASPGHGRETLTAAESQLERVMLLTRLARGCPVTELDRGGPGRRGQGGRGRPGRPGRAGHGPGGADPAGPAAGRRRDPRPDRLGPPRTA